jgi:8-oxo-dGTP pyrophosphatase MutT (NUDIX family)
MSKEIVFTGHLFEIEQDTKDDGRVFEIARRAPGVRLIVHDVDNKKLLLTKEYRHELQNWDYRLPGGKVFDSLDELHAWNDSGQDILQAAIAKAKAEGAEEAGIDIKDVKLVTVSTLGATVEWDLFVFVVNNWAPHELGQQLEKGEQIETDNWFTYEEVWQMILEGKMQEERIALALLRWLHMQIK